MKTYYILVIILLSLGCQIVRATELGRLFTTPEQRQTLDRLRAEPPPTEKEIVQPEAPTQQRTLALTVNGIVFRQQGNHTTWVNGANIYQDGFEIGDFRIDNINADHVQLTIPETDTTVKLKIGKSYEASVNNIPKLSEPEKLVTDTELPLQ